MSEKKEIVELFKTLQGGLKRFTLTELNQAIGVLLKDVKNNGRNDEIKNVISEVCKNYNINKNQLINSNSRGKISQAKSITYCLLHFELGLTIRYISKKVFFQKHHGSVAVSIRNFKNINTAIKPDKEFLENYEKIKKSIKEKQPKTQ